MESLGTGGEGAKALFTFLPFYPFTFLPLKAFLPFLVKRGIISHSAYFPIQKFWHSAYQALPSYLEPLFLNP